jgi:transposase
MKPIALLADRLQETVAYWLKQHPTIQTVARDRSKEIAAAITNALPEASHVVDHRHLAKNLTKHLDKVVSTSPFCPQHRARQSSNSRWTHASLQYMACGKTHQPPEAHQTASVWSSRLSITT